MICWFTYIFFPESSLDWTYLISLVKASTTSQDLNSTGHKFCFLLCQAGKAPRPRNLFAEKKAPETQRDLESTSSFVACSSGGGIIIFGLRQADREAGKQGAGSLAPRQLLAFPPRPGLPGQNSSLAPALPCRLHRKPQWQLWHLRPSTRPLALANIFPTLAAWVTHFPFNKHAGVLWI